MKTQIIYKIYFFNSKDKCIDSTEVNELNDQLIWQVFEEHGYTRKIGDYYEYDEI